MAGEGSVPRHEPSANAHAMAVVAVSHRGAVRSAMGAGEFMSLVGNLEDLSLGDILQIISLSQKSGVLVLSSDVGAGRIVFRSGLVQAARLKGHPNDLRELLVGEAVIDPAGYDAALARSRDLGTPVEETLTAESGLTRERIDELVTKAAEAAILEMFSWPAGDFSFDVRSELDPEDPHLILPKGINAQYLAMEGLRIRDERSRGTDSAADPGSATMTDPNIGTDQDPLFGADPLDVEPPDAETLESLEVEAADAESAGSGTPIVALLEEDALGEPRASIIDAAHDVVGAAEPMSDDTLELVDEEPRASGAAADVIAASAVERVEAEHDPALDEHVEAEHDLTLDEIVKAMPLPGEGGASGIDAPEFAAEAPRPSAIEPRPTEVEAPPPSETSETSETRPEAVMPGRMPVVLIDPDVSVLEWTKSAIEGDFARVHMFQQADQGLTRIRQYLIRGETPLVLVSPETPIDPLSGIHGLGDFVKRLKAQSPRIVVLGLREETDEATAAAMPGVLDGVLGRPARRLLGDPDLPARRTFSRRLLDCIEPQSGGSQRTARSAESLRGVRDATVKLREASSRGEILPVVLDFAAEIFARVAILVLRDGAVFAVAGRGIPTLEVDPLAAELPVTLPVPDAGWIRSVIEKGEPVVGPPATDADRQLLDRLGGDLPERSYLGPIDSSEIIVAMLYADQASTGAALPDTHGLEIVLHHAGLALDRAALERALWEAGADRD